MRASQQQKTGPRGTPASERPVLFIAWRDFWLLREQTKWQGQGAKRPGAEQVATCPGLSGSAPLKGLLKSGPPGKTTPPSINHSNYKAEKEKQREKDRREGRGVSQKERQGK